ncbi:MAG: YoaK family protein [Polyangiales bacterium]
MYPQRQEEHASGWFTLGAITLAGLAGLTNSAAIGLGGLAVSHLTGSISRVSAELSEGDTRNMLPFTVVLVAFFVGAVVSGATVSTKELGVGRRYAALLVVNGALLAAAAALARTGTHTPSLALASLGCGMQNALASSYRGMVVRTTHMTGIVTDLGFEVGVWLRTRRMDRRVLRLHAPVLVAFFAGGTVGALATARVGADALYFAAALSAVSGLGYLGLRLRGLV